MAAEAELLCLGEPLVEFNQVAGTSWRQGFGGDVSNVAIAAARQGADAGIVARLGADRFGQMLRDLWRAEGVAADFVVEDADAPTGLYFVTHGASGHEFHYRRAGSAAARLVPAMLPDLGQPKILHFSGITQAISPSSRAAAETAARQVRAKGGRVSYDPNLRLALWPSSEARPAIRSALSLCDIALPGLDDARQVFGLEAPEEIIAAIRTLGPEIIALTMGAEGVLLATEQGIDAIPTQRVAAKDATGAGDCFDGAFLARLLAGDAPEVAATYAATAAALSTRDFGAIDPIPRAEEVTQWLNGREDVPS